MNRELLDVQAGFRKGRGTRDQISNRLIKKEMKTQQWPQDWKRSVFIPVPKNAMPKNVQTTAQLHVFHMLTK